MAVNPNTQFSSGSVYTADEANRFPRGVMGAVYRTAGNITMSTSATDVTGMAVTFTAEASRTYKASWTVTGYKTTSNGWAAVYCNIGATTFAAIYATALIVGTEGYFNLSGYTFFSSLTAGSQTIKLQSQLQNAGGTIFASGTNPCVLMIEDCGPS
jgi:hypothetical protein